MGRETLYRSSDNQSFKEDLCFGNQVNANDSAAFDTLLKKYHERMFSIVYNMTPNRSDDSDKANKQDQIASIFSREVLDEENTQKAHSECFVGMDDSSKSLFQRITRKLTRRTTRIVQ
jgi:hypothetical protein